MHNLLDRLWWFTEGLWLGVLIGGFLFHLLQPQPKDTEL